MRRDSRLWAAAAIAAGLMCASSAEAQTSGARVLVTRTQTSGYIPDHAHWQAQFDESVVGALRQHGNVVQAAPPSEPTCADDACFAQLAAKFGVDAIVSPAASIDNHQAPPNYHLTIRTFNRADGRVVVDEQTCRGCGEQKAVKALAGMASAIQQHAAHPVVATVEPPRRSPVPTEPPARSSPPVEETRAAPPSLPPPAPHVSPMRPGMSPAALTVLAVATAIVGVGAIAITAIGGEVRADDGNPTCATGPASKCATLFDTRGSGGSMIGVGAVAIVGAGVALGFELDALKKARRRRYSVAPAFGRNGFGVAIGGVW